MARQSIFHRFATKILEGIGRALWGFKPNLMRYFVEQHGPMRAVSWFATNMPKYEKILKQRGPIRTHFLASAISILNGCKYCTTGHALAFELHYLQQHDRLFPLSVEQMFALSRVERDDAIAQLKEALLAGGLAGEVNALERLVELIAEPSLAQDAKDKSYLHLIEMFGTLNACGIVSDAPLDAVHDPINKDTALLMRYKKMRASSDAL